jgi:cell wall-associated NlpC family hydrolase
VKAPRDADLQVTALGEDIAADAALKRGDLVFFPGHVGIMADSDNLLHATGHWGKTLVEPLADVIARVVLNHTTPVLARKRIG